jgi:hypothetical protein
MYQGEPCSQGFTSNLQGRKVSKGVCFGVYSRHLDYELDQLWAGIKQPYWAALNSIAFCFFFLFFIAGYSVGPRVSLRL